MSYDNEMMPSIFGMLKEKLANLSAWEVFKWHLKGLEFTDLGVTNLAPLEGCSISKVLWRNLDRTDLWDALEPYLKDFDEQAARTTNLSLLEDWTILEELNLGWMKITDLSPLEGLTNLKKLYLFHTNVANLSPLKHLTKLDRLHLSDTPVSDISPLKDLMNLSCLILDTTQIRNLPPMAGMVNLKELHLSDTPVRDLSPLKDLANLEGLYVFRTSITKEVVQELQEALPNCTIRWDGEKKIDESHNEAQEIMQAAFAEIKELGLRPSLSFECKSDTMNNHLSEGDFCFAEIETEEESQEEE